MNLFYLAFSHYLDLSTTSINFLLVHGECQKSTPTDLMDSQGPQKTYPREYSQSVKFFNVIRKGRNLEKD